MLRRWFTNAPADEALLALALEWRGRARRTEPWFAANVHSIATRRTNVFAMLVSLGVTPLDVIDGVQVSEVRLRTALDLQAVSGAPTASSCC
jgi:hypothetical protein